MSNTIVKKAYDFRELTVPETLLYATVTKAEIQEALDQTAGRFATFELVTSGIRNGDIVALLVPDEKSPDGAREEFVNMGRDLFPGEEALLGLCVGAELSLPYGGKVVTAKILRVKRKHIPRLTDEMVSQLGIDDVSTITAYQNHLFQLLADQKKDKKVNGIWAMASKAILSNTEFEPITDGNACFRTLYELNMQQIEAVAQETGMPFEQALATGLRMPDKSADECYQALRDICADMVKQCALGKLYAVQNGTDFADEEMSSSENVSKFMMYFSQVVCDYYKNRIIIMLE